MKSITLYEYKNSFLNHIDPFCKLLYILAALSIPLILGVSVTKLIFIAISIFLIISNKVFKKVIPLFTFSAIIILTAIIIQGLFYSNNKHIILQLGPLKFYKEGLLFAYHIALNVLNILLSFAVLIFTTKPTDLIDSFVRVGFSPRFGYVLSSVFQIIPQMSETMSTISDAQKSRGMESEGNLFTRIKAFFPLISPVITSSLINTRERAIALEVRGFNSTTKKTFLNQQTRTRKDKIINIILLLLIILSSIWRIITCLK
ncbi:energy-coupling factor transporter transmembrane component T family protein [Anaeromicropila herbilytica]|uniref:Cobalt ABC transporter permease n=1 Tax=Anaeromicropila herbilytica TaxID=2785025 RepID=A0A7R7IEC0_9FIRM|nr:energy-coupling factor transporter transmembrane component T [Anaeromicropila herbilytica]BCN32482.1 cobalt ABC transporter permease [Anaeromicropila herbilytica]